MLKTDCFFQAVITMVPEAWQKDKLMLTDKKHFYQWSSCVMEPWDGPGKSARVINMRKAS